MPQYAGMVCLFNIIFSSPHIQYQKKNTCCITINLNQICFRAQPHSICDSDSEKVQFKGNLLSLLNKI